MPNMLKINGEIDLLAPLLSDLPVKDQLRSLRHLLHKLDKAAADSDQADDFQKLLFELRADITARLSAGSW